jgi:hypothetical protein
MDLQRERMVALTGWEGPLIKPWQLVAKAQKLVEGNDHIRRALIRGGTHVWVRYIGYKLIVTVYNLQSDEPRVAVDKAIAGKGFWLGKSKTALFHCMPEKGDLPKSLLTMIFNVDY